MAFEKILLLLPEPYLSWKFNEKVRPELCHLWCGRLSEVYLKHLQFHWNKLYSLSSRCNKSTRIKISEFLWSYRDLLIIRNWRCRKTVPRTVFKLFYDYAWKALACSDTWNEKIMLKIISYWLLTRSISFTMIPETNIHLAITIFCSTLTVWFTF